MQWSTCFLGFSQKNWCFDISAGSKPETDLFPLPPASQAPVDILRALHWQTELHLKTESGFTFARDTQLFDLTANPAVESGDLFVGRQSQRPTIELDHRLPCRQFSREEDG
jgi:hypothetical protein